MTTNALKVTTPEEFARHERVRRTSLEAAIAVVEGAIYAHSYRGPDCNIYHFEINIGVDEPVMEDLKQLYLRAGWNGSYSFSGGGRGYVLTLQLPAWAFV